MFAIQDKTTGTFFDIPDSEKLQITITSSLFETSQLSGASSYELTLSDSPNNAILFNFIKEINTSSKFVAKRQVLIWLDGSPWNDATMTLRAVKKNGYQVFLSLGISAYIDEVLNTNIKKLKFPQGEKYRIAKRFIGIPLLYRSSLKYIGIYFKTAVTECYFEIKADLDGSMPSKSELIDMLNNYLASWYAVVASSPEFMFVDGGSIGGHPLIKVYSGLGLVGGFDIYHVPDIKIFQLRNGTYQRDPLDYLITDAFSICALRFAHFGNAHGMAVNSSVQEYVSALNANPTSGNEPFVFAPVLNSQFYTPETKPISFINLVNATGKLGEEPIYGNTDTNKNKYLISPQIRLNKLLEAIQNTYPDIFDFGLLLDVGVADENIFFKNIALYNAFSAHKFYQYIDPGYWLPGENSYGPINTNLDETDYAINYIFSDIANFDEHVYFSDVLPSMNIAQLVIALANLFSMNISFNFFSKKIEMKPWKEILKSPPKDISPMVSVVFEKEAVDYSGLALVLVDDQNDKKMEEKFNIGDYILIDSFTKQEFDDLVLELHPIPVDGHRFLSEKIGARISKIYYYALDKEVIETEPTQEGWLSKICAYIEELGYFVLKPDNFAPELAYGLWVLRGQKFDNEYSNGLEKNLEINIANSQFFMSDNPLDGHGKIPETKQLGRYRIIYPGEYFSLNAHNQGNQAPFDLRLFLFDCSRIKGGDPDDIYPRAIPLQFLGEKFTEGEYTEIPNIPIHDFHKDFETFLKNTDPFVINMKIDSLFLKNYYDGAVYKIGSQHFLFKELRVEIPKKKLGNNERYSAEADVYIIRNYSV